MSLLKFFKSKSPEEIQIENWVKKAQNGDAEAMFELGYYYDKKEIYDESTKWYLDAMEMGHTRAKYHLALNYAGGMGGPKTVAVAVRYLNELIDDGYERCCHELAWMHSNFKYKAHPMLKQFYDLHKAEKYYIRAINAKSNSDRIDSALYELGVLYAGDKLFAHVENTIENPIKAGYCLYLSTFGGYQKTHFETLVKNAGLSITNEELQKWKNEYDKGEFVFIS